MTRKTNVQQKLAGNAVSGMTATAIYLVTRLLLTPYILHYLSLAEFGLWSLCFIILSYASMGGFGVNSTYIRYTALYHSRSSDIDISRLLSTGITYMLCFSLLFCGLLLLIMPLVLEAFHIEKARQALASMIFLGTAAVFSLELTLGGFRFIINGMHEIAREKKTTTIAGLIEIGFIVTFLYLGAGIKGLLYAYALRVVIETISFWKIAHSLLPTLSISRKMISREHFRLFFVFGGKVQVLGAMGIFVTALDRMFITALAGLSAGGMLELGRKLPFTAKKVAESAFGPFLPTAAHLDIGWEKETVNPPGKRAMTYLHITAIMLCIALIPVVFFPFISTRLPFSEIMIALLLAGAAISLAYLLNRNRQDDEQLKKGELRRLYLNGLRYTNMISVTLFAFLIAIAHPLIMAWVGPEYRDASIIMIFLSIAYVFQLSTGPANLIFRGIDRNGKELEYTLVQLTLLLCWIPSATIAYGLKGSAAAIACSSAVSTIFLFWRSNYTFQISFGEFAKHTLVPALAPVLPAIATHGIAGLIPGTGRIAAIMQVGICGIGYSLMVFLLMWKAVLGTAEKTKVLELTPFFRKKEPSC